MQIEMTKTEQNILSHFKRMSHDILLDTEHLGISLRFEKNSSSKENTEVFQGESNGPAWYVHRTWSE